MTRGRRISPRSRSGDHVNVSRQRRRQPLPGLRSVHCRRANEILEQGTEEG